MTNWMNVVEDSIYYLILFAVLIICYIPIWKTSRLKALPVCLITLAVSLGMSFILGYADALGTSPSLLVAIAYAIVAAFIFSLFNIEWVKRLYVFLLGISLMSFADLTEAYFDALLDFKIKFVSVGAMAQLLITVTFIITMFIVRKQLAWILDNLSRTGLWLGLCSIPLMVYLCNVVLYPFNGNSSFISDDGIDHSLILIQGVLITILILSQAMAYQITYQGYIRNAMEQENKIKDLELLNYEKLNNILNADRELRHDFRQTVYTLLALVEEKKYSELSLHLQSLADKLPQSPTSYILCEHPSANALLSYYVNICIDRGIKTNWRVIIPEDLPMDKVDLCQVIGNLLDNAVKACGNVPLGQRFINLSIDQEDSGELFIVCSNSFDGIALQTDRNLYASRKKAHDGIGLSSIEGTANKYKGVARFYHQRDVFYSEVMFRL